MQTKFIAGKYKYPVNLIEDGQKIWVEFTYNKNLIEAVRLFEGAKWHGYDDPPVKKWSIANSLGNKFRIELLEGKNPYAPYDAPLLDFKPRREKIRDYQVEMFQHIITRQYCIEAAEPALGKTLVAIEVMEWLYNYKGIRSWFYVAPKSALIAVNDEFQEWRCAITPQFFTYDALKSIVENWPKDTPPPMGIIFDESQKLKTPTAQRTIAAQHIADSIRVEHGSKGAVILMTGTPAPKNPLDYYSQVSVACPGFIRQGSYEKFRQQLAFLSQEQSESGQAYVKLVSWKDDELKCKTCGKFEDDSSHDPINMTEKWFHPFEKSVNEIARLYKRFKGLVDVRLKKDCLSLPDKIFKQVECKPTREILNAAKLIVARGGSALQTMMFLRELSDGFQYEKQEVGVETCPICNGEKSVDSLEYIGPEELFNEIQEKQSQGLLNLESSEYYQKARIACNYCNGTGESAKYLREAVEVPCPKEDKLIDILDEYEDWGRIVIYAGFTGSINRCVRIALEKRWNFIRVDGRGWFSDLDGNNDELYKKFKYQLTEYPRLAFIGHPASGGAGLNLQQACCEVFYSNDFVGESRMQAIERIHRPGMDENRGATIIDLVHLPTDKLIIESHNKKKRLQDISLGQLKNLIEE